MESSHTAGRMPEARIKKQTPHRDRRRKDERHHTSVRYSGPTLGSGSLSAPLSARAVAAIRPAPTIFARPAFLFILSGPGQWHARQEQFFATPFLASVRVGTSRLSGLFPHCNHPWGTAPASVESRVVAHRLPVSRTISNGSNHPGALGPGCKQRGCIVNLDPIGH
jgi:hypothetical protein